MRPGEFVLGYPNGYRQLLRPGRDSSRTVGRRRRSERNGTYLVAHQLAQDVAGFWAFIAKPRRRRGTRPSVSSGGFRGQTRRTLAEPLLPSVVVSRPGRSRPPRGREWLSYSDFDPFGERCPLEAYPACADETSLGTPGTLRLASLHRIIRRGRVYGSAPADHRRRWRRPRRPRCAISNLERQFEFVQHSWTDSRVRWPLRRSPARWWVTPMRTTAGHHPGHARTRVQGLSSFVTQVRGGRYFLRRRCGRSDAGPRQPDGQGPGAGGRV